jgi:ABC-type multidrug transport system permease subunit
VLGSGLQQLSRASTHGVDLRTFIIGKCIGGATVASLQGVILIFLAGAVDVPYDPLLILGILGVQLLLAFSITAFGVMVAARITQMQSFMGVMQMIVMPMFFISGALYPVAGLPGWLAVLNRPDPRTMRWTDAAACLQPPRHRARGAPRAGPGRDLVGLARVAIWEFGSGE